MVTKQKAKKKVVSKSNSSSKGTNKTSKSKGSSKVKIDRGQDPFAKASTVETSEADEAGGTVDPMPSEAGIDSAEDMTFPVSADRVATDVLASASEASTDDDADEIPLVHTDQHDQHTDQHEPSFPAEDQLPTRYLKCILTQSEIADLRDGREKQDELVEKLDAEHLQVSAKAKELKERISGLIAEGRHTSKTIREGFEYRDVACFEKPGEDTRAGSLTNGKEGMQTIRIDTEEVIDWRELSAKERQGKLWDDEPKSATNSNGKHVNGKATRSDYQGGPSL